MPQNGTDKIGLRCWTDKLNCGNILVLTYLSRVFFTKKIIYYVFSIYIYMGIWVRLYIYICVCDKYDTAKCQLVYLTQSVRAVLWYRLHITGKEFAKNSLDSSPHVIHICIDFSNNHFQIVKRKKEKENKTFLRLSRLMIFLSHVVVIHPLLFLSNPLDWWCMENLAKVRKLCRPTSYNNHSIIMSLYSYYQKVLSKKK